MQKTLYLVRHAIAETQSATGRDGDRELTREGAAKFRRAALGLKRLGVEPDLVLSSPLRRALQTAALLCEVLAPGLEVTEHAPLSPGRSPEAVLNGLRAHSGVRQLVLVGHEPDLGQLASQLLTGLPGSARFPFKKGAVAAVEIGALPPRDKGELQWFLTPRQLRALGGERI